MSEPKERVDVLLVERGYYESREKAKAAVMAGLVFLEGARLEKAGMKIPVSSLLSVKGAPHPYVSRGGLKLEKAIRAFGLNLEHAVMLDIGASTGGFTDCALRHGASFVYAIDVGYNQLDWRLRSDSRVCVMERVNFRYITPGDLTGPPPTAAATDVSFISLKHILPPLVPLLPGGSPVVALIKPQFEAGKQHVGKSGVVRDASVHLHTLYSVVDFASEIGYNLENLTYSPITGSAGNIEFLALWRTGTSGSNAGRPETLIEQTVEEAHRVLMQGSG